MAPRILQEGSKYSFTLPSGESAEIFVTPIKAKGHKINAKLVVDGTEVVEGMDDDDDAAAKGK